MREPDNTPKTPLQSIFHLNVAVRDGWKEVLDTVRTRTSDTTRARHSFFQPVKFQGCLAPNSDSDLTRPRRREGIL